MKKSILIFSILAITGCTSLNIGKKTGEKDANAFIAGSELGEKKLVQNSVSLENGGAKIVLDDVKHSWEQNISRELKYTPTMRAAELYAGETLIIRGEDIASVSVMGEGIPNYQLVQKENYYLFRSVFQQEFPLRVLKKNGTIQTIMINNILKYKLSKNSVYENIRFSYNNRRYEDTISAIDLYNVAFPNDIRENELNILLFSVHIETMNSDSAYKRLPGLKKISDYTESEITSLFKGEIKLTEYNLMVDEYYLNYAKKYSGFSNEIVKYLKNKKILSDREYGYLLAESEKTGDEELKKLLDEKSSAAVIQAKEGSGNESLLYQTPTAVSDNYLASENQITPQNQENKKMSESDEKYYEKGKKAYELSRYDEAIVYFNNISDKNQERDIFYFLGNSYLLVGNYSSAITTYKSYINTSIEEISKAEALHNIAFSYEKLGDYANSVSWYKEAKDKYPGTTWARKSNIALIRLKNKPIN